MEPDLHADLDHLVRSCECAIRRGDAPNPAALHTLQQQLVAARDAPSRAQTEDTLQTAIQYYRETVPEEVRTTGLADLTEQVDQLGSHLELADDSGHRITADADDD